jgi:hypothetical protein
MKSKVPKSNIQADESRFEESFGRPAMHSVTTSVNKTQGQVVAQAL